jgi:hypothetical protein
MKRYVIRFFKTVMGDNGHTAEICQRVVQLEAPDADEAAVAAKQQFCDKEQIAHWALHADRVHVAESEFPS